MTDVPPCHRRHRRRVHLRTIGRRLAPRGGGAAGRTGRSRAGTRRVSGAAELRARGRAARHLARRRRGSAARDVASPSRAGVRDSRLRRGNRRCRSGLRGRAHSRRPGGGRAVGPDHRSPRRRPRVRAAASGVDAAGDDRLYQRHDRPAQGRRDDAPEHRRPSCLAGRGLGLEALGSPAAGAAAAPRARHRQRAGLGAGGSRHLRDAAVLRCGAGVGSLVLGRHHGVHRGADHLQPPRRLVGCRLARAATPAVRGHPRAAPDDVGVGGPAGPRARAVAGDHRPHAARTLRHD